MAVPDDAKVGLLRDGFVVLRSVVPHALLDVAVRAINTELAQGIAPDELSNGAVLPALAVRPAITNLYDRGGMRDVARAVLGDVHGVGGGQIALRFPGLLCGDTLSYTPLPWALSAWHLDGLTDARERFAKRGTISHFSCLIGVALRDVPAPFHGNLVVFPGSHRVLAAHFNADATALPRLANDGEPALPKWLPFDAPVQVCMKAGDVVLCHYQLAHSVAPNAGPDIRYVVYFRVYAKAHTPGQYRPQALRDIWMDWEGMRTVVNAIGPTLPPVDLTRTSPPSAAATTTIAPSPPRTNTRPPVTLTPQELDNLLLTATKLFDQEKWAEARPAFQKLSDAKPNDFMYTVKAAIAFGLGDKDFKENRAYYEDSLALADRTILLAPDIVVGHCLRVRALVGIGMNDDAISAFKTIQDMPPQTEALAWSKGLVLDSTRCVAIAYQRTGQADKISTVIATMVAKYPEAADAIKLAYLTPETAELFKQGEAVLAKEPKDWRTGQTIFSKLAQLAPDLAIVQLQAAACFTYGAADQPALLKRGESYAGMAIGLEPASPAAYAVLARNLIFQHRYNEVLPITETLLQCRYEATFNDLIVDGLRCLRQAHQRLNRPVAETQQMAHKFKDKFPQLAPRFDAVLNEQGCSIL